MLYLNISRRVNNILVYDNVHLFQCNNKRPKIDEPNRDPTAEKGMMPRIALSKALVTPESNFGLADAAAALQSVSSSSNSVHRKN